MTDDFGTPISPTPYEEPKKKSNTTLIIVIVVVLVLICCCCALAILGYSFGDAILQSLGIYY
jgi:hypothetical protein